MAENLFLKKRHTDQILDKKNSSKKKLVFDIKPLDKAGQKILPFYNLPIKI